MSQAAATALLLGVGSVLWLVAGAPLLDERARNRVEIARLATLKASYIERAAQEPALARRLDALADAAPFRRRLIVAPDAGRAVAAMRADIERIFADAHSPIRRTLGLRKATEGAFDQIGLRIEGATDMAGLHKVLAGIEAAPSRYRIDALSLRRIRPPSSVADLEQVAVEIELAAYWRRDPDGERR